MASYRRILLKLSGEALGGAQGFGIDPPTLDSFAAELAAVVQAGVQLGVVVGGGNLLRGAGLAAAGVARENGDYMGMLATVMNGIALADAMRRQGVGARVFSALAIDKVGEVYHRDHVLAALEAGEAAIFVAGTGNPYFTTDTAASLRAIEIGAELLLKGTQVDGVYSADPKRDPDATRFQQLDYDEALARGLAVVDATALVLLREQRMPLRVFNIHTPGELGRAAAGEDVGTLVRP